eukprot:m51a1_g14111 hypothetical protein (962) ;mRNA; f:124163-127631
MGKAYLRYALRSTLGAVTSANAVLDATSSLAVTGALEAVAHWHLRRGDAARAPYLDPEPSAAPSSVTVVARHPRDPCVVAAGHDDGVVRVWDERCPGEPVVLAGHRGAVACLAFDAEGAALASGGRDTDVVVWDVQAQRGLFRLRGHTGEVTAVCFSASARVLFSASKDAVVKAWDLDSQHCVQTLVGHRCEVLSMAASHGGRRLYTGASDGKLRVWAVAPDAERKARGTDDQGDAAVAELAGEIAAPVSSGAQARVTSISVSADDRVLAFVAGDKYAAFYRIIGEDEAERKRRRREARQKQRRAKKQRTGKAGSDDADAGSGSDSDAGDAAGEGGERREALAALAEEYEYLMPLRAGGKVRSIDLSRDGRTALLALHTNALEAYEVDPEAARADADAAARKVHSVSQPGHRTDIRALAISSDNATLVSTQLPSPPPPRLRRGAACADELKVWNVRSGHCVGTVKTGYGLSAVFVPGNRHVVVGTKEGTLELVEVQSATLLQTIEAHGGAVWSVALAPDKAGIVTGSADKSVKFWEFDLRASGAGEGQGAAQTQRQLTLTEVRAAQMEDDVLCVRYSPSGKLLAVALLDCTVKVYKVPGMQFFLSLYGHKLPVLSVDISEDGLLLISGSADKNIKIWGLDFGDCHRSLIAHSDSVMQLAFVPGTHYFFSVGKDRLVKYWDADKFEEVQKLDAHRAEVWCLAVSSAGEFVATGSHDRSVRVWERTDEQLFLDEEKEKELDTQFEATLEEQADFAARNDPARPESEAAARKTLATIRSGEALLEALEMAQEEDAKAEVYRRECEARAELEDGEAAPARPEANPEMLGLSPAEYVLKRLAAIPSSHMDQALLLLPFHQAAALLGYLARLVAAGRRVELCAQCACFVLRVHHAQVVNSGELAEVVDRLWRASSRQLEQRRDTVGYNLAAMRFMQQQLEAESGTRFFDDVEEKLAKLKIASAKKKN